MKMLGVLLLVCFLSATKLFAQVQLGVRAGVHRSVLYHTADQPTEALPGFVVAVPVQIGLSSRWSLRVEPSLMQRGGRLAVDYMDQTGKPVGPGKGTLRYSVAEFPLLVTFRQPMGRTLAVYGLAGPGFGAILNSRWRVIENGATVAEEALQQSWRTEVSFWGGGGVTFPLGRVSTFVDVRYQAGLSPFAPVLFRHSRGISFTLGCWLPARTSKVAPVG